MAAWINASGLVTIGGVRRRSVRKADAVNHAQIDIDDLETLLALLFAGDQIGRFGAMRRVPQALGAWRRRHFGGHQFARLIDRFSGSGEIVGV